MCLYKKIMFIKKLHIILLFCNNNTFPLTSDLIDKNNSHMMNSDSTASLKVNSY